MSKFRNTSEVSLSDKEVQMVISALRDQAYDIKTFDATGAAAMRQLADHIEREVC